MIMHLNDLLESILREIRNQCVDCNGWGRKLDEQCETCNGTGVLFTPMSDESLESLNEFVIRELKERE